MTDRTPPTEAETTRCNACNNTGSTMSGGQHGRYQVCGCCHGGYIAGFGRYGHDLRAEPKPRCQS